MTVLRRIRRAIWPSHTLAAYVARLYAIRFLLFLLGLSMILQVLDLMGKSDDILAADGATYGALLDYLRFRLPQLLSQFTPFAALLGVVSTLVTLNQNSEVIVMKSVGLSAYRILAPTFAIGLLIALAHFVFQETVVVRANASLNYWQANDYATNLPPAPTTSSQAWMVDGPTIIRVESIEQNGRILMLDYVTLYQRNPEAVLTSVTKARYATYIDGAWTLFGIDRFTLPEFEHTHSDSEPWPIAIPAERFVALAVKPDEVSFFTLLHSIQELSAEGTPVDSLKASLYHKLSGPLSSLLMPLLAAVAAFGLSRGGQLFIRVVIGMALGFAYFVADNFMMAMSEFGAAPALLSAWAPFLLFMLLGLTVLFYTEE